MSKRLRQESMTAEQILEICHMVKQGRKVRWIADYFGVSQSWVSLIARNKVRLDVVREPVQFVKKITIQKAQQVLDMRRDGIPAYEIQRRLGISKASISQITIGKRYPELDRTGIQMRKHGSGCCKHKLSEQDAIDIVDQAKSGTRQKDIAEQFGVSRSYICRVLKGDVFYGIKWDRLPSQKATCTKTKVGNTREQRRKEREAKRQGMQYNQYGMLVPLK